MSPEARGLPALRVVGTVTEQLVRLRRGAAAGMAAVLLAATAARAQSPQSLGISEPGFLPSERIVQEEVWAQRLVEALGLEDGLPADPAPQDLYGLLCPEEAVRALAGEGATTGLRAAHPVAPSAPGEAVRVVIEAPVTALYQLHVEGTGPQRWSVDQRLIGHLDPTPLGVAPGPRLLPLRAGPHEFTGILLPSARVDRLELSAWRPLCIAPADGWHSGRALLHGARARTLVRALGLERYLPAESAVAEIEGERFDAASQWGGRTNEGLSGGGARSEWAMAGESPAEFTYRLRLPQPGLFTLEARVGGGGGPQLWSLDGRLRASLELPAGERRFHWLHVMTTPLSAGEHVIRALVPARAGIDRIRIVARSAGDPDYVEVLEQMGFREAHVHSAVSLGDTQALLRNPVFELLTERFLEFATRGSEPPLPAVPRDLARLYQRPLAPVLPSDL